MQPRQGSNADIVHRQNGGFPSREGGFDSHYPLQGCTSNALHGSQSLLNVYDSPERRAATSPAMAQTRRVYADVQPVLFVLSTREPGTSPAVCTMAGNVSGDASLPVLPKNISCGLQKQLVFGNWYLPLTPRCNSGWA